MRSSTLARLAAIAVMAHASDAFRTRAAWRQADGRHAMDPNCCRNGAMLRAATITAESPLKTVQDVKEAFYRQIEVDPSFQLPAQFQQALTDILDGMTECATEYGTDVASYKAMLGLLLKEAGENSRNLYQFPAYHKAIRGPPHDFTKFGETFFDITIVKEKSAVLGRKNLAKVLEYAKNGDNVVLLANHQTEPDPYILRAACKRIVPADDPVMDKLVFVAGAKVRTDLFTIPFSKGLSLICIHSKKYIEDDPETKPQKMQENLMAMKALQGLMNEGGHIIWVAPSGGRDRMSKETGKMAVAPFDPRACDMFRVLAAKADRQTHFFPLSMLTYKVLPPPEKVAMEVGERRLVARRPVHIYVGDELTPERVLKDYIRRKAGPEPTDDQIEELTPKAKKEAFSFVAEADVKEHYDVLLGLDTVLEEPEIEVVYR